MQERKDRKKRVENAKAAALQTEKELVAHELLMTTHTIGQRLDDTYQ